MLTTAAMQETFDQQTDNFLVVKEADAHDREFADGRIRGEYNMTRRRMV